MTADPGLLTHPALLLRSTPHTVVWGHIPAHAPAALRIASGEIVRIDTVSHQGLMKQDPTQYFGEMVYGAIPKRLFVT